MVYNPATDFLALWRSTGPNVVKLEIPGLDFVLTALARAGAINLTVSGTAPVANQATTAWLRAAAPSYSAEGAFFLWDKVTTAYLAATPRLFLQFLEATAGQNGVSWWATTLGPPLNTVGNDGDFAIRTDAPGGVYGPKVAGVWPASPLPGTVDAVTSATLDNTFGAVQGQLIYRGAAVWSALGIGALNTVLTPVGGLPNWQSFLTLCDTLFGADRGSVLYRGAGQWNELPPGSASQLLSTNGPGADPSWVARTPEFASGTTILFQQTTAPIGWTKQVALDDYALRVTSGTVGVHPGTAFTTVFAQTVVGDTTLTTAQTPPHTHTTGIVDFPLQTGLGTSGGGSAYSSQALHSYLSSSIGGGTSHNHSINLTLSYIDVIIAVKN